MIGFISLICFTFFYTNKISTVIKENDDILKQINDIKDQYKIEAIDAVIDGYTIIPGVTGKEIDVKKSYKKMKSIDKFNPQLLVYKSIKPNISVNKVYDKYIISGSKSKKEVSLIFLLKENENIDQILNILDKYNIKASFFTTIDWFENNNELITKLINENHVVGNLLSESNYLKSNISWMNAIVTKIEKQDNTYCFVESKNDELLNICKLNKSYTIMPTISVSNNPLIEIKQNLKNGSIISLNVNDNVITQLPLIIEYINSKGLDIVTINDIIDE